MNKKDIKELLKKEIVPYLVGLRNEIADKPKDFLGENEIKGVIFKGEKGKDGYTPIADKDYPSEQTVFDFIKDNLPKRGKDYFTDSDIKDIVSSVFNLMPSKEELKGKDGENGQVDYSVVEKLALPLIKNKYKAFKKDLDYLTDKVFKAIEENKVPEISAENIRNKLESLKGNARLDAKAIKGLEKYLSTFIATSGGGGGGGSNISNFADLNDVDVTGVTVDQSVKYDGSKWIPYTPTDLDEQTLQSVTSFGASTSIESTFSGGILAPYLKANTSAGILFESNSGTDVALFGAGGGAGATFYGGVNVTGALSLSDRLNIDRNGINFTYVTAPTAPTVALAGVAGLVPLGTYWYYVTYVTADGETNMTRTASSITVASAANAQVVVTIPVSSDPRVTARKIYRSTASVVGGFLATVADNVTTTYTDNIATVNSNLIWRTPTTGNTTAGNIFSAGTKNIEIDANGAMRFLNGASSLRMSATSGTQTRLAIFNTADEENNAEYGGMNWTSNIFEIGTFGRGAGLARRVRLKSSNVSVSMNFDLERGGTDWASIIDSGTSIGGVSFVRYNPTNWTNNGSENRLLTLGTVGLNQTASGGFSLFNIDATGGTGGSGSKFFSRFTLDSTTIHSINNLGQQYLLGNIGINTTPNTTYNLDAVGAVRSGFRFTSGTRSLAFANFAADVNYLSASGGAFRISTTDASGIEFWLNNTRCASLGAGGNAHFGTVNTISTAFQFSIQPTVATNKGLVIRGFTAQTGTLTEWQSDGGSVLAQVNSLGNFGIGSAPATNTKLGITNLITTNLAANAAALDVQSTYTPASNEMTFTSRGAFFNAIKSGTFNSLDVRGFQAQAQNSGTGTLTSLYGFLAGVSNVATGTVTNGYGAFIVAPNASVANAMTNAYGLYVSAQARVGVTNAYGIWQQGASDLNYFAGSVQMGATGQPIRAVFSATATLDFPSIGANDTASLTMTVTGAAVGDSVHLGAPSTIETGLVWSGYVSATNTVTVRVHNTSGGAVDPASATWRATVMDF